jgi:predicted dehydrogenase
MPLRFGLLGAGKICYDFALALQTSEYDAKIVAVSCSDKQRGEEFAKKFNIEKYYSTYEEVINDDDVDIIYNGLINTNHINLCIKAAEKKKHILCEKPIGLNPLEVVKLIHATKKNRVFFMEAIWSRCMPSYQLIRNEINAGTIGTVRHIDASFQVPIENVVRVKRADLGGGGLYDIGIYLFQLAFFIVPHDQLKTIHVHGDLFDTGVDRCGNITMLFKNGVTAFLGYHTGFSGSTKAIIHGDKGQIEIPEVFWAPCSVLVNGKTHDFGIDPEINKQYEYNHGKHLQHEIGHVVDCVKKGLLESPAVTWDETLAISQAMFSVCKQLGVVHS